MRQHLFSVQNNIQPNTTKITKGQSILFKNIRDKKQNLKIYQEHKSIKVYSTIDP